MQLAGAVADLMDIQGSSVLVCLEDGWNSTAQVSSSLFSIAWEDEFFYGGTLSKRYFTTFTVPLP